jgi:hypothetical protein
VSTNQNNSNEELNAVPVSQQNELPANNAQPPLENEEAHIPEPPPLIPQTDPPMEVHHHGHVHETKKWKEYLFQFFMLFLAVFCGFLAENLREHYIESHRAKEYAKSFISDIKADTSELHSAIHFGRFIQSSIDSLVTIYSTLKNRTVVPGKFYYYSRFVTNFWRLDWNNSTINQLVQSGNLRYIKNKELVEKINRYYASQSIIGFKNEIEHETRMITMEIRDKILDGQYFSAFASLDINVERFGHKPSQKIDSLMELELPLSKEGSEYLNQYINVLIERRWRLEPVLTISYPKVISATEEIIGMLEKEYDL